MAPAATIEQKEEIDRSCGVCGRPSTSKCSLCKSVYYCSIKCQKRDWKSHKKVCKKSGSKGRKNKHATKKNESHTKIGSTVVVPWKMEDFPDAILVHIALQTAKLCSLRDYIRFSQTSKRIHKLLHAERSVGEIVRTRSLQLQRWFGYDKVPMPQTFTIRTMEQLGYWNSVTLHSFDDNRILFGVNSTHGSRQEMRFIGVSDTLLFFPSATLVMETHVGTSLPGFTDMVSRFKARFVAQTFVYELGPENAATSPVLIARERILLRLWPREASEAILRFKRQHYPPRKIQDVEEEGWVELYLRMEDPETGRIFEWPPRPDYYNEITSQPEEFWGDNPEIDL